MSQIGVALFGAGRAGNIHFQNLIKNYRIKLLYVADLDVNKGHELVEHYFQTDVQVISPEQAPVVYADTRVQAVVVCSPTFTHEDIVRGALSHGKAVFCEKPISEDIEGTNALYKLAAEVGRPLLCSFNRRYDPNIRELRNRVLAGEVGNIHIIKTTSRDHPFPPLEFLRLSGGLFHDCAVHDIDMVCWVLGEYPESVYAQGIAHVKEIREMEDVDTATINLRFRSGVLANIDLSRNSSYGYDQRLEVFGSGGMLISENHQASSVQSHTQGGSNLGLLKHSFPQRYAESYVAALDHFVNVIEGKETAEVSGDNTLKVTVIAAACEKSHRCGKPIHLSFNSTDIDKIMSLEPHNIVIPGVIEQQSIPVSEQQ